MKIYSWNVNGLRAVQRKKVFPQYLYEVDADIFCVQETKSHPAQLTEDVKTPNGYQSYFSSAEKKGYSGVATYVKQAPLKVQEHWGQEEYQQEGRILQLVYDTFTLYNIYFPNGRASAERLQYKMQFYQDFLRHLSSAIKEQPNILICGDINTAHKEIDLARPKENAKKSGFLPEERAWMDELVAAGFVDTLRHFNQAPDIYTFWDTFTRARERNVGWRIDYFFASTNLLPRIKNAAVHADVMGSDHCPVSVTLDV